MIDQKEKIDYIYQKKLELFHNVYNFLQDELNSSSITLTQQVFEWFGEYLKKAFKEIGNEEI